MTDDPGNYKQAAYDEWRATQQHVNTVNTVHDGAEGWVKFRAEVLMASLNWQGVPSWGSFIVARRCSIHRYGSLHVCENFPKPKVYAPDVTKREKPQCFQPLNT